MRNIRVYYSEQFETGQAYSLEKATSHYLLRVLRLKEQQAFTLFDGKGCEYHAQLEISGKTAIAHIESSSHLSTESNLKIHLLQGISKGDRMDFVIQKSVELGVHKITPVICERTVVNLKGDRLEKKRQHWNNIAISACEQSGRNHLPEISVIKQLDEILQEGNSQLKLLLNPLSKQTFNSIEFSADQLSFLIGPEGGLTDNEINHALQNNFSDIQLGPRVLRTETAALAAITAAQVLWGDFN
ncbi:16S rRNA (uracil(1498)-N(3))-methyltransferase [hydrothermal vent metagenome]|uniref:16S rRNA (uracil(1498)-N(3))-methyltransferase n=1 Tax=hydrothermal vent metagenome TaxID=652676 RepID=A0A3B0XLX0_9ZZZZ